MCRSSLHTIVLIVGIHVVTLILFLVYWNRSVLYFSISYHCFVAGAYHFLGFLWFIAVPQFLLRCRAPRAFRKLFAYFWLSEIISYFVLFGWIYTYHQHRAPVIFFRQTLGSLLLTIWHFLRYVIGV